MHKTTTAPAQARAGVVLLVVLAMLSLFAIVALSFVFYADSEASASRYASQAQSLSQPDVAPELLLNYFLSQLIYDTDNINSAMRGHSLSRTMYGASPNTLNVIPFNGEGRLRYSLGPALPGAPDNYYMVNYQYYPSDGFIRYPEVYGTVTDDTKAIAGNATNGANVSWTYPDTNNMFLAAVDGNGNLLIPSFSRYNSPKGPWAVPGGVANAWTKYVTLRPDTNYHTNFSSPDWDGTGDVRNLDGMVSAATTATNDSIWMDLGFPLLTGPDGKKYKPMFASCVVDLDNRLNLSVHGNIKGSATAATPGTTHASHMGYDRSEVNLSTVLTTAAQYQLLFKNANNAQSPRYGIGGFPTGTTPVLPTTMTNAPWYSQIDFDGVVGAGGGPLTLPPAGGKTFSPFPTYPGTWYDTSTTYTDELTQTTITKKGPVTNKLHPAAYNYFATTANNNPPLPAYNQEALMRFQVPGAPTLTSPLFQVLANDLANLPARNQLTVLSMDLNLPGVQPYLWQDPAAPGGPPPVPTGRTNYQYTAAAPFYPKMTSQVQSPTPGTAIANAPTTHDFGTDWRSTIAYLKAVDLNNPALTPYPAAAADTDRQKLAKQIYNMLIRLTGCRDPNDTAIVSVPLPNTNAEFQAARFLAQIAVNIVDYVDEDDVMTQYAWYTRGGSAWVVGTKYTANTYVVDGNPGSIYQCIQTHVSTLGNEPGKGAAWPKFWSLIGKSETVYGTELPRLVINEVYSQIDNDPLDPGMNPPTTATRYNVNVWAELLNPFKTTPAGAPYPKNGGTADLSKYQILLTKTNTTLDDTHPENVKGDPDSVPSPTLLSTVAFPAGGTVLPSGTSYSGVAGSNQGFYVIGPSATSAFRNPSLPTTYTTPANPPEWVTGKKYVKNQTVMDGAPAVQYKALKAHLSSAANEPGVGAAWKTDWTVVPNTNMTVSVTPATVGTYDILLQRLANPNLPSSATNPYVTVDYYQMAAPVDERVYNPTLAAGVKQGTPVPFPKAASMGRRQPYSAVWTAQNPSAPPPGQPLNTFYRHNGREAAAPLNYNVNNKQTLDKAFQWLVHLDRPVVNPIELLQVSGYAPHRLTQKVIPTAGANFSQRAFWEDQTTLTYRLLEMIALKHYMDGEPQSNARTPGKININTIWDQAIWQALCDAQVGNSFTAANVNALFPTFLMGNGKAATANARTPSGTPAQTDIPFTTLGTGSLLANDTQYKSGLGMNISSILRGTTAAPASPSAPNRTAWVPGAVHPYQKYELLSKIYNNVTTRSNCFAVWVTVGFFEVDDSAVPPKLLSEVGRSENRHIRHRMFAIIDRTNLLMPTPPGGGFSTTTKSKTAKGTSVLPLTQVSWPLSASNQVNVNFNLRPGMQITVDTAKNQETVEIYSVDPANRRLSIKGAFANNHAAGVAVTFAPTVPTGTTTGTVAGSTLGNPGPQEGTFDPRQNTLVVPHFSLSQ